MKAIVINEFGSVDVLYHTEISAPEPKENEVLVQVHACGLNPVDYKIRSGYLNEIFPTVFPRILGGDVSGIIKATGANVKNYKVGDAVFFSSPLDKNGGYAEYCVVDQDLIALKPLNISHLQAASFPVAGLTSMQALRDFSSLGIGHKVLIHAGAGGVGSFAIQYAKHLGATVYTTASESNFEYVKSLGADVVIDYKKQNFVEVCQTAGGMDVILESIGKENYIKSIDATKVGGAVPCIVDSPDENTKTLANEKRIKTDFFLLSCDGDDLREISQLISSKKIIPGQITLIKFDQIKWGHSQLESGRTRRKIILDFEA